MPKTPILITGCQRSGTTLLRMILNSHPHILSIDEDRFSYPSINTYLNAKGPQTFVSFKLPQYAPLLGFLQSLPHLRTIWCLRDPVDTVWSMMKLKYLLNDNDENNALPWAVHPSCAQIEIANSYWSLDETTKEILMNHMNRFQEIVNKNPLDYSRDETIFTGALCWAIKNALPVRYKQEGIDFHPVKYEELVTSPEDTIRSLLGFIGADWNDDVLKHHEKHEGDSIGGTSNTRPIDSRGVGQGIANFTDEEVEQIRGVCGSIASNWNYT